jgi:hypothetical protein
MQSLRDAGFVADDTIEVKAYPPKTLRMCGQIGCKGNIILTVDKLLERVSDGDDPLIQTVTYSYHAAIRGGHNILRYDNQHVWKGHVDPHHKHNFDVQTGDELDDSPIWIDIAKWPTLGEVLRELMQWHEQQYNLLADPDVYATPERQSERLQLGF